MTHVISVLNVNHAFKEGWWAMRTHGVREDSRNGPVLVMPGPVVTEYRLPMERVLFNKKRDANPVFHLMECVWMMAGARNTAFLEQFNPRMAEYAENGVMHGAYGHRWRYHFGTDQLISLAELLKKDHNTRQAVLQMWDPRADIGGAWKDRPCFSGDTTLWSPEGDLTMSEVADKFSSKEITKWPVFSVDEKTKEMSVQWCDRVWKSGRKKTLRITFDDESTLRITPDHILYPIDKKDTGRLGSARDAVPRPAKDLRVGDRVLATRKWVTKKGHEVIKRRLGENTNFRNIVGVAVSYAELVWGPCPEDVSCHHVNEDKRDNRGENLVRLTNSEHSRIHKLGDDNPMRNLTADQHRRRAKKQSASISATWSKLTPEQRSARSQGLPLPDNHVITKIEEGEEEDVFDFSVPGRHTALVGTGVVAHNCNTAIYFDCRGCELNMTVTCRSNDMLWGAYGANAVHFSFLQEVLARHLKMGVGVYRQFSNNFHVYLDVPMVKDFLESPPFESEDEYTHTDYHPLLQGDETMTDMILDCVDTVGGLIPTRVKFMTEVVTPLYTAYMARKTGKPWRSIVTNMVECDWKVAFLSWTARREENV